MLLDVIDVNKDIYRFEFYGIDDLSTGWGIEILIKNSDAIIDYFNNKAVQLVNHDDFIDYLFVKKNCQMNVMTDRIIEEYKDTFAQILNVLSLYFNKINTRDLICYMNDNIECLLSEKSRYLINQIFVLAFKYHSVVKK